MLSAIVLKATRIDKVHIPAFVMLVTCIRNNQLSTLPALRILSCCFKAKSFDLLADVICKKIHMSPTLSCAYGVDKADLHKQQQ